MNLWSLLTSFFQILPLIPKKGTNPMMLQDKFDSFLATDMDLPGSISGVPAEQSATGVPSTVGINRIRPLLAKGLAKRLRFGRLPQKRTHTKTTLLAAYNADCDRLNQASGEFRRFLFDALFSSIVYGGKEAPYRDERRMKRVLQNAAELLSRRFEPMLLPETKLTDAALVESNSEQKLQCILTCALEKACHSLAGRIFETLQAGVDGCLLGRVAPVIEGHSLDDGTATAAQYYYFTRRISPAYYQTTNERDALAQIQTAMHLHDVVDLEVHRLPARSVQQPRFIPPLLKSIPKYLRDVENAVTMISGSIVLERVAVKDVQTKEYVHRWPMHQDPALLIANTFVVTGWGPFDLASRSPIRRWIPDMIPKDENWHENAPSVKHFKSALEEQRRIVQLKEQLPK